MKCSASTANIQGHVCKYFILSVVLVSLLVITLGTEVLRTSRLVHEFDNTETQIRSILGIDPESFIFGE